VSLVQVQPGPPVKNNIIGQQLFNMTKKSITCSAAVFICLIIIVTGCVTKNNNHINAQEKLRIGVTPNYPPLIFETQNKIVGLEADFAGELSEHLDKHLVFVKLKWNELVPALLENKIDIIMSGMTVTKIRKIKINYTKPYMKTGQMALMKRTKAQKYQSVKSITNSSARIGVQKNTTGEIFVETYCPNAEKTCLENPKDCLYYFRGNRIDLFIYDAPGIMWLAADNEAELTTSDFLLTHEQLAWGIRKQNTELLQEINTIIEKWEQTGKLNSIIGKWIPRFENIKHK
jgi:ABC-type amino acid transport substrate-binding protein